MELVGGSIPIVVSIEVEPARDEFNLTGVGLINTGSVWTFLSECKDGGKCRGESLQHSGKFIIIV